MRVTWHGHAQHFICARSCQFRMATSVGPYVISTVGEYDPKGSDDGAWTAIGCGRLYETMVFRTEGTHERCGCPLIKDFEELECAGYNDPVAATKGHMLMLGRYIERAMAEQQ